MKAVPGPPAARGRALGDPPVPPATGALRPVAVPRVRPRIRSLPDPAPAPASVRFEVPAPHPHDPAEEQQP